jgi:universal stress protein A
LPVTEIGDYWIDIPSNLDLTEEIMAAAKKRLTKLAERLNVPQDRMWLEMGSPKLEIVRVAKENNVDLIIVGSHGRHGLALLLGSTANGVLHHAVCDVLAVRLRDD